MKASSMKTPFLSLGWPWAACLSLTLFACSGAISSPEDSEADPEDDGPAGPGGGAPGPGAGMNEGPRGCRASPAKLWQLTPAQVHHALSALVPGVSLPTPEPFDRGASGFRNEAAVLRLSVPEMEETIARSETVAQRAYEVRGQLEPCLADGDGLAEVACVESFVRSFGKRAFRRPLASDEVTSFVSLFRQQKDSADAPSAFRLLVTAITSAPEFLFRTELGSGESGTFELKGFEKASALAFFLTDGPPDADLLSAAEDGSLDTTEGTEKQVARLFASEAGRRGMIEFFRQWFGLEEVPYLSKDEKVFPSFSQTVARGMQGEAEAFINHFLSSADGRWRDLYTSRRTFVNDTLARFYGFGSQTMGEGFKAVDAPAQQPRAGLLTLGAVQASLAREYESDPIVRGVFIQEAILCRELPPPPADANAFPPALDPSLTTRERLEQHRADEGCRACHQLIDLVGLGFENYDGIGRFRTTENGKPVDVSGTITLDDVDHDFSGPAELGQLLSASQDAKRCFARQVFRFATGRLEDEDRDLCLIEAMTSALGSENANVQQALTALVSDPRFWQRTRLEP